jgi:SAM-dependent methyltransferase
MKILKSRDCPICGSDKKEVIHNKKFGNSEINIVSGYTVVMCLNCGMTYADNIPKQEVYDQYYEKMSKYEIELGTELDKHFKEHAREVFNFVEKNIVESDNILDVGCSNGYFLRLLKEMGFTELYGIDPSQKCVDFVSGLGIEAQRGVITRFVLNLNFNFICLSAVLEHVVDIKETMKRINYCQTVGDLLFIAVPALEYFCEYINVPFQQFNSEHINYFREKDLENLLSKFGYEIIEIGIHKTKRTNGIIEPDLFILAGKRENNIYDYIIESYDKQKEIINSLKKKLEDKENIIVWGAGECSKWLFNACPELLEKVIFFTDNDARLHGKYFIEPLHNTKIVTSFEAPEIPILISSMAHAGEIEKQIKDMGLTNEVIKL